MIFSDLNRQIAIPDSTVSHEACHITLCYCQGWMNVDRTSFICNKRYTGADKLRFYSRKKGMSTC